MSPIGGMCYRLALEQPVRLDDGAGGAAVSWGTIATLWASMEELSGREEPEGGALAASRRVRFVFRYQFGVQSYHRLRLGTRIFDIVSARSPGKRGRRLICECIERT